MMLHLSNRSLLLCICLNLDFVRLFLLLLSFTFTDWFPIIIVVFPPFWILGVIILISPLSAPADFHANKPESERQELITIMRKAELKWARRCLFALAILLVTIGVIVGIAVGVMSSTPARPLAGLLAEGKISNEFEIFQPARKFCILRN